MSVLFSQFLLAACFSTCGPHAEQVLLPKGWDIDFKPMKAEELLEKLNTLKDDELYRLLVYTGVGPPLPKYSMKDLDELYLKAVKIQYRDPYFITRNEGEDEEKLYMNRFAARTLVLRLRIQKLVVPLLKLPMEARVNRLIQYIEKPPWLIVETTRHFTQELVFAGREAVPHIIKHRPKDPYHRGRIAEALATIGDPGGLDYIIEILHAKEKEWQREKRYAAFALAKFKNDKAIRALIEALKDDAFTTPEKDLPKEPGPNPRPFMGRFYFVRHAAGHALSEISGMDWGPLYNEEYKTWDTWLKKGRPEDFEPSTLKRTEEEWRELFAKLFDRFTSPSVYERHPGREFFNTEEGFMQMARELHGVGVKSVGLMMDEFKKKVDDNPNWDQVMGLWVRSILRLLPWPEAKQQADTIKLFRD
ncbi:MAG: HEAT repeat domain-containing protein [Planctomycetota bacterium]|nr:HEAT repeat domain-containing protein [Planctomycetota bacterium]MDP7254150.1 HEAT repeat domain-containing protein [Planctomycetota bacterium]